MNLLRQDNWPAARQLHSEIDRLFRHDRDSVGDWLPAVDIREENERFVVEADLPGVDPQEIEITMEDGALSLRGSREVHKRDDTDGLRRVERVSGRFFRRFALPDGVDADNISARSNNGVLEIDIPKQPQVQRRRIDVNVS
ncbi:MAG: Hsp20/alpha crystallin family protein [Gammaproteobacteria bacterium]|nr:Hsp20/alpha crystallin family protein [Gammaproteobacteria bacterium]